MYGLLKHYMGGNVLEASYRVMSDDWGISSQTADLHFRWNFGDKQFLQPRVRLYTQSAADFYQTVLFAGEPVPAYATADYRLARFDAVTLGLKYGKRTRNGEFSARMELYRQSGKPSPGAIVGSLADVNLYPDLSAVIVQLSYNFGK